MLRYTSVLLITPLVLVLYCYKYINDGKEMFVYELSDDINHGKMH